MVLTSFDRESRKIWITFLFLWHDLHTELTDYSDVRKIAMYGMWHVMEEANRLPVKIIGVYSIIEY